MTKKRAILALIAAAAILGGVIAFGSTAGATGHPTYPHPECEDDTYGNEYCTPTTEVTTTTVKCPPKSTTTTTVVTTTTTPSETTTTSIPTTTAPPTTEKPEVGGPPQTVSRPPVVVDSPEFPAPAPAPPGVTQISFTG